jgi:hypothetical protein
MMGSERARENVAARWGRLWTRVRRSVPDHPGPVGPVDLDPESGLCRKPLGAVTAHSGLPQMRFSPQVLLT